jgi:RNA polymerase sigma factor (TIGR02999 family)
MTNESAPPDPIHTLGPLILAADAGDAGATAELFTRLYDELHRLAESQLRRMRPDISLSATTLLHDLYLSMSEAAILDRGRFMAYAARAMRGIVIDAVRARRAEKRGGEFHITRLPTDAGESLPAGEELSALGDALDALARTDPALAEVVNLSFFGGLSFEEIAALRGVSERTVQRDWRKARLFLKSVLMAP